jgi:hypothetical protein
MSRSAPRLLLPLVAAIALMPLLGGCNSVKPTPARALDLTFYEYSSDIRWSDFEAANAFVDPKVRKEHPLTELERSRYKQIQVSSYDVVSRVDGKGTVDQQVQIGIINRNTQIPRNVLCHEHWVWDGTIKKWWLASGLPDITPQD